MLNATEKEMQNRVRGSGVWRAGGGVTCSHAHAPGYNFIHAGCMGAQL